MEEVRLGQWLTLAEVAERTGRRIDAVRAWGQRRRRERRHTWRKSNSGEWTVEATPEMLAEIAQDGTLGVSGDESGSGEQAPDMREEAERLHQALTETRIGHARFEERLEASQRRERDLVAVVTDLRRDLEHERNERAKV